MNRENIDTRKVSLIARISALSNEALLRQLEEILNPHASADTTDILYRMSRPMRKKLDIDVLIQEQGFKRIDRKKFNRLVREIDIQEPLEQLIAAI
jgi:hypothetical protein